MKKGKRKQLLVGMAVLAAAVVVFAAGHSIRKREAAEDGVNLEGQWKVTEYFTSTRKSEACDFYEHFLGRNFIIEPNRIIVSLELWPQELCYQISQYRFLTAKRVDAGRIQRKYHLKEEWKEKYGGQELIQVDYSMEEGEEGKWLLLVTEEGEVLVEYRGNFFYMERYKEAESGINMQQLYGDWEVKRLVSYEDGWWGNNAQLEEAKKRSIIKKYTEEKGANFYPETYIGNEVEISAHGMELYQEGKLLERCEIEEYAESRADKYEYQNERKIHDELGIVNDKLQIFTGIGQKGGGKYLEGELVVISEKEVIIKIYQGWYLLEKR